MGVIVGEGSTASHDGPKVGNWAFAVGTVKI